jgi:5-methylcytosine-specific restriction endonuclease McrA
MSQKRDQRPYNLGYYKAHRDQELERVRTRQREAVEFLRGLRAAPCADCGREFPPYVMDFDHRVSNSKSFWVLQRAGDVSHDRLMAELEKCDIVCANCHRARTHARALERRRIGIESGHVPITESRRRRDQTELLRRLRDVPCADCQGRFPFFAMDFDHRIPIDKEFEVTRMLGRVDTEKLLEEASKCDIVCANCHRKRTYEQRMATRVWRSGSARSFQD